MTHRRRLIIVAAIIFLVTLGFSGIYLWQNLVFTGETRAIPGTPHHFLIQAGVSENDLALVGEGIRLADLYFTAQLAATLSNPIEVRMARTTPCVPFEPLGSGSTAVADKEKLCVDTLSYAWTKIVPQDRLVGLSIIAHEHFHNLQGQTGCLPGPNDHEYAWWVEGSATYIGWHTLVEAGLMTEAQVMDVMHKWGGFSSDLGTLASYEKHISGDPAYALAYRAIDELVQRTGSPALLYQFCQIVGQGQNWRMAFEAAYGISVADFYTQFEQSRLN